MDEGTTFTLYLPVLPDIPAIDDASPESTQTEPRQGKAILLVEDQPAVLKTTVAMLEHLGDRVIVAANGEQALAIFEEHQTEIALVLSDLTMPDMNGETLFRRLRAGNPHLKMVLMSGYPLEGSGAKLLAQGIAGWLQKSLSFGELSQVIANALSTE